MKYPKRSQYKYAKSRYRVRNWAEYEAGLRKRGDLTVWLSDAALGAWRAPASGAVVSSFSPSREDPARSCHSSSRSLRLGDGLGGESRTG